MQLDLKTTIQALKSCCAVFVLFFYVDTTCRTFPTCKAQKKTLWSPFSWPRETLLNQASQTYNPEFSPEQCDPTATRAPGSPCQLPASGARAPGRPRRYSETGQNTTPSGLLHPLLHKIRRTLPRPAEEATHPPPLNLPTLPRSSSLQQPLRGEGEGRSVLAAA